MLEIIKALTRERFPAFDTAAIELEPLEKGGSDRKFYRLRAEGTDPLIFVQYGQQKEENRHYVEIGMFLESAGVRVPRMLLHEPAEGRIWMEDLGEKDLWTSRNEHWEVRRPLYEKTLREIFTLHQSAERSPEACAMLGLQPPFDAKLYHWEQEYFFNHCAGRHLGIPAERFAPARARLHNIAIELEGLPRSLVHRDFQSQNVIVRDGTPCLIDFQGMRFGLPQYDLASLFLDPYVELAEAERTELMAFYKFLMVSEGLAVDASFERIYQLCAAQRLMQALGAYGFLGHEKKRASFLTHIPVALPRLITVLKRIGDLDSLGDLLEEALPNASLQQSEDGSKNTPRSC